MKTAQRAFLALVALCALAVSVQAITLSRRAVIVPGGGHGRCTIEVDVDGAAEVEIFGDMGNLRTLSGQVAVWRRFECNGVMPRNPFEFRFHGVDGRGHVELIREPRNSGGRAVVRIDDPRSGREGYTFDLEWRGERGTEWAPPPPPPPVRREGERFPVKHAIRVCQDGVLEKLNADGFREVNFERTAIDDNPGRNDWVVGTVTARRGRPRVFSFSCSVDFSTGRVRTVDVR